jgi:hypothetical protein
MVYFIAVLFAILNVIEGKLESLVIALKNWQIPEYAALNRAEHKWSAIYYLGVVMLVSGVSILAQGLTWKIIPTIFLMLVIRRLFFDYSLKFFRHRPIAKIEGDMALDVFVRKVLGPNGGWKELFLLIALLTGLIFLTI